MNQREVRSIRAKLARLARNECSLNQNGGCPAQQCGQCVVEIRTDSMIGNVCPYFMRSVLPSDPTLNADYLDYFPRDYPLRKKLKEADRCEGCNVEIEKRNNRHKFCDKCSAERERAKSRERNRKYRDKQRKENDGLGA